MGAIGCSVKADLADYEMGEVSIAVLISTHSLPDIIPQMSRAADVFIVPVVLVVYKRHYTACPRSIIY